MTIVANRCTRSLNKTTELRDVSLMPLGHLRLYEMPDAALRQNPPISMLPIVRRNQVTDGQMAIYSPAQRSPKCCNPARGKNEEHA